MTKSPPNPYAPGAGYPPPELAGRDEILADARLAIENSKAGRPARSFIFVGLRGVGKTVLLNEVQNIADDEGALTDFIEVSANEPLSKVVVATLRSALLKLDRIKGASEQVKKALRVLKSFVGAVKVKYEDIEFSLDVDAEPGVADSGTLARDLAELFLAVGQAAKARKKSIVILIDEIQILPSDEFEALIMAIHRVDQKRLPLLVVGAGLPLLVKLAGDAKSYAERLFDYPDIGPLDDDAAKRALVKPAKDEGVSYEDTAIKLVIERTKGYPYFLQEWGYQCWKARKSSVIKHADAMRAGRAAVTRLDKNFFKSRYERLSDPQKDYLRAMAELGAGPHRTGAIAEQIGKTSQQLAPHREALIQNGMIYSPRYGYAAFTVPLFDEFIKRAMP
ncbi:MAG TPA: AAA family ATPase [Parvularculaceae bacterium]|nr:AAA family ATPase [Amphiplicatus sp.]HPE29935.1 AAA family ATPase [Parvularculaceae bacterium]